MHVYAYRTDPVTAMCDIAAAKSGLDEVGKSGLLRASNYEFFCRALAVEKPNSLSVMVQEDFERELEKYFAIQAKHYGDEPSAPWYPIYVLKNL